MGPWRSVLVLSWLCCACGSAPGATEAKGTDDPFAGGTAPASTPSEPGHPSGTPSSSTCSDPDGDGYGPGCSAGEDCAPGEPHAHPGATELCFDKLDNDCDGQVDEDCGGCDPQDPDCGAPVMPATQQTLGEFVFDLSKGALKLDPLCGPERGTALDGSRSDIVGNIDALVTTDDAVTMAEVARNVMKPLLSSGDLESATDSFTDAVALLVDDNVDPERKTMAALVALLQEPSALKRADVLSVLDQGLSDARAVDLVHALRQFSERPVGASNVADQALRVASDALNEHSQTAACAGLSLTPLSDRLLASDALAGWSSGGTPALIDDVAHPGAQLDVTRTGLGMIVELLRDALRDGVHRDASQVLDASLGTAQSCGADCMSYPAQDHPLADGTFVALDVLRYDELRALLQGLSVLLHEHPEVAERLLVASGKLIERARAADIDLEPAQLVRLARELLPLLEKIFAADAQTPRLLLSAIHNLGNTARDFPQRLAWTLDYKSLVKSPTCSDNAPDLARSTPVNYTSVRGNDNRSSLEQVIELLSAVDCGSVPFTGGKSVGLFVLDTVAGMRPGTVCGVTDTLLGALHITGFLGDFATKVTLKTIGCSNADDVVSRLGSLEDLAASGALDFLIPLDKVFRDQNQLRTLIDIFKIVAADLALDNDNDPSSHSVFRQLEPVLSDLIAQDSADSLFDLTDVLVTAQSTDAQGNAASLGDVLVDAVAFAITQRDLTTRAGVVHGSHASELLGPAERVMTRLSDADSRAALNRVLDHVTSYLRADAGGKLTERAILPFSRLVLDGAVEMWTLPRATRDCYVNGLQQDAVTLYLSSELARAMAIARVYRTAPEQTLLESTAVDFLSPATGAVDVRTPLLQVLGEALQTSLPRSSLHDLVPYLSNVLDPERTHGAAVLRTLDVLLQNDHDRVFLGMAQKAVHAGAGPSSEPPVAVLLDAYTPALAITGDMCSPEDTPWTARGLDSAVASLLTFLRDPNTGLPALFAALKQMAFP